MTVESSYAVRKQISIDSQIILSEHCSVYDEWWECKQNSHIIDFIICDSVTTLLHLDVACMLS